jgi:MEMO1 family protein
MPRTQFTGCSALISNCGGEKRGIIVPGVAGLQEQDRARMPAPSVRPPAVAGMFYPADPGQCQRLARHLVYGSAGAGASTAAAAAPTGAPRAGAISSPPARPWKGAIVPHAGWIASGAIAGESLRTLAAGLDVPPELVVVFAAVHTPIDLPLAALDSHARWAVPGGESRVAQDLGERLLGSSDLFAVDDRMHDREHAVEVELPLIQAVWPTASVLPVEVPLTEDAAEIGRHAAAQVRAAGARAVFLASSDLTHYGPSYGFAPAGVGMQGLSWAKDNDRRLLELVAGLAVERIVPEVRARANACGGGAIAAMLSACLESGATRAEVLRHANSYETLAGVVPQRPVDAVGYAAVAVG